MNFGAAVVATDDLKWAFFGCGLLCLIFEYAAVYTIFAVTIGDFQEAKCVPSSYLLLSNLELSDTQVYEP